MGTKIQELPQCMKPAPGAVSRMVQESFVGRRWVWRPTSPAIGVACLLVTVDLGSLAALASLSPHICRMGMIRPPGVYLTPVFLQEGLQLVPFSSSRPGRRGGVCSRSVTQVPTVGTLLRVSPRGVSPVDTEQDAQAGSHQGKGLARVSAGCRGK